MPSRHNTPCHRHDNRAVANTTRYPEGGTSRALTGPEGTRRLTEGAGRAGAKEKTTAKTKGQQKPATPQAKTKQKTKGPPDIAEHTRAHKLLSEFISRAHIAVHLPRFFWAVFVCFVVFCVFCFLWFLFCLLSCWFVLALGNWIALWTM